MLGFSLVFIFAVLWSVLSCARFFFSLYSRGSSLVCTLVCSVFFSLYSRSSFLVCTLMCSVFFRLYSRGSLVCTLMCSVFFGVYSHVLGFSLVCILAVLHWSVLSCARDFFSLYSRGSLVCTIMCSVFR